MPNVSCLSVHLFSALSFILAITLVDVVKVPNNDTSSSSSRSYATVTPAVAVILSICAMVDSPTMCSNMWRKSPTEFPGNGPPGPGGAAAVVAIGGDPAGVTPAIFQLN